jgi:hypothetical protein
MMTIAVEVIPLVMGALGFCLVCWAMHRLDCQEIQIVKLRLRVEELEGGSKKGGG